jgi:hypothetical protein
MKEVFPEAFSSKMPNITLPIPKVEPPPPEKKWWKRFWTSFKRRGPQGPFFLFVY